MYISSNANIFFHCKICNININNKDRAIQCDICQFWIHMKCNKLNHTASHAVINFTIWYISK